MSSDNVTPTSSPWPTRIHACGWALLVGGVYVWQTQTGFVGSPLRTGVGTILFWTQRPCGAPAQVAVQVTPVALFPVGGAGPEMMHVAVLGSLAGVPPTILPPPPGAAAFGIDCSDIRTGLLADPTGFHVTVVDVA